MNIKSKKTKVFNLILGFFMVLITVITLYPVWFSLINSLNSASAIAKHGYAMVLPDEFSTASWQAVLKNSEIVRAFFITLARTILVTAGQTVITSMLRMDFQETTCAERNFMRQLDLSACI